MVSATCVHPTNQMSNGQQAAFALALSLRPVHCFLQSTSLETNRAASSANRKSILPFGRGARGAINFRRRLGHAISYFYSMMSNLHSDHKK